ncbi:MAG: MFS transporter [Planctomycetota bacterium]|nr:MAG: MFS transporter [Planctomycetota bacterium]
MRVYEALTSRKSCLRILYFMYCASLAAWQPLLAVYFNEVGISGLRIGIIMSIAPVMVFLVQPMWGVVADRWGHHRTLLFTMFLASFAIVGYVWNGGFWFFFFWTIVVAFVTNPIGTLLDSTILDYVKERQDSSYGRFRMWGAIGWTVSAPIVGWIITGRSITLIFPISMAVMLLGWLAGFLRRDKSRAVPATSEASWQNLSGVLRNWRLIVFLVIAFFYGIGSAPVWSFFGVYLKDIGASRQLMGVAFGLDAAIELPFYFFSNFFVKRFGAKRVLTFAVLMFAVRLFLYSVISTPILAVSVELMHGLSYSLFIVSAVEYVNELVPAAWRATGQSLYAAACFGAGTFAGNTFAGYLYDQMPLQQVYRFIGWLLLVVTLFAVFALRDRSRKTDSKVADE